MNICIFFFLKTDTSFVLTKIKSKWKVLYRIVLPTFVAISYKVFIKIIILFNKKLSLDICKLKLLFLTERMIAIRK